MRMSSTQLGRLGAATITAALVASAMALPASAATSGVVTVTGGSASTIELTLSDASAAFGTNLTPDGSGSGSDEVTGIEIDGGASSAGACYEWAGSVTVRSNMAYGVTVAAAAANNRLDFLTSNPADYAACTSGTQVGTGMFPGTTPGAWVTGQSRTATRTHGYWLGLDVQWGDAPNASLGAASLTLTAGAGW